MQESCNLSILLLAPGSQCRMCSKSHLCVDQLREDCLLPRLSPRFGSACGCSGRGGGNTVFSTLRFVDCHLPGKLLPWSLTEPVGPHLCQKAVNPPRGVRLPLHSTWRVGGNRALLASLLLPFPLQGQSSGHSSRSCWSVPAPASPTHFVLHVPAVVFVGRFEILE